MRVSLLSASVDLTHLQQPDRTDARISLHAEGTSESPVVLRAETPGQTVFSGKSELRISGRHVVVEGIAFENPQTFLGQSTRFRVREIEAGPG